MASWFFQEEPPMRHSHPSSTYIVPPTYETRAEVFEKQFQDAFYDFLGTGGFIKETPCVTESWERQHRQRATCKHGLPTQKCVGCRTHTSPYTTTHPV